MADLVHIAYASAQRQILRTVSVSLPCTVGEAINQSGILALCPEIDISTQAVGIWNEHVTLETQVQVGDRVEIYRSLLMDPMTWRRQQVRKTTPRDATPRRE
jgi:putative ubiquitin-RnfH superfamily antitoxin RatB of RatAB toxin-antitoxin module